jgi:hypothetical protein
MGGANQQERLEVTEEAKWFLAGFIEGEGSLLVSIKPHETSRYGYYVDPEFHLVQHRSGLPLLKLAQQVFGTGRIFPKPEAPTAMSTPSTVGVASGRRSYPTSRSMWYPSHASAKPSIGSAKSWS